MKTRFSQSFYASTSPSFRKSQIDIICDLRQCFAKRVIAVQQSQFLSGNLEHSYGCVDESDYRVMKQVIDDHKTKLKEATVKRDFDKRDRPSMIGFHSVERASNIDLEWARTWMPAKGVLSKDTTLHWRWKVKYLKPNPPYVYSKVVQEKRAIEIAASQSQYDLSILAIGGTFGPMCSTHGTGVSAMVLKYIRLGLFFPAVPKMAIPMNDVRDVAAIHSLVMSSAKAKGRYLTPQKLFSFYEICDGLRTDPRTWRPLLPLCHFPDCFKGVFACLLPHLGFDSAMAERLWGAQGRVDSSKVCEGSLAVASPTRCLAPPSRAPTV